jgi:transposase
VLRYLNRLRAAQDGVTPSPRTRTRPGPPLVAAPKRVLTPRTAAWAVLRRPERRSEEDKALLAGLRGRSPVLDAAVELAEEFAALVRLRKPDRLDPWLKAAQDGPVAALRRFAKRLLTDDGAVRGAVTLDWSNGQTEGQINRLKALKPDLNTSNY